MAEFEQRAETESPLRPQIAELPSCTIRYFEAPAPAATGRPILMLHGWPQDALIWRKVATALAGRRRLLAPDLRGFGQSEAPGHGYSPRYYALDQIALLNHLGIPEVDLIGHDWGGWTALLLGLERPGRIGSILAASAPHPWVRLRPSRFTGAWRMAYTLANAAPILGPALHRDGRYTRTVLSAVPEPDRSRQVEGLRPPTRAAATRSLYLYYHRALWQVARGHWRQRRLELPLHLISGDRDGLVPASLFDRRDLAANAPAATLEIVAGAGHFLVDERPELIAQRASRLFGIT